MQEGRACAGLAKAAHARVWLLEVSERTCLHSQISLDESLRAGGAFVPTARPFPRMLVDRAVGNTFDLGRRAPCRLAVVEQSGLDNNGKTIPRFRPASLLAKTWKMAETSTAPEDNYA